MYCFIKHIFKLQFLLIVVAVLVGIYYSQILAFIYAQFHKFYDHEAVNLKYESAKQIEDEQIFTKAELAKFNGENDAPIYLALLGSVFDVSKGAKHYGPGCAYNYFVGRDASVSFISGEFEEFDANAADDVLTLQKEDLLGLVTWRNFYDKQYSYKGKVIGRFFDNNGTPTKYHHKFLALVEQAQSAKAEAEQLLTQFPDCNIEWSVETDTRVWCTNSSGGKERDWEGVPRKLYQIGSTNFRCACVQEQDLSTSIVMLKPYDNCALTANECYYKAD